MSTFFYNNTMLHAVTAVLHSNRSTFTHGTADSMRLDAPRGKLIRRRPYDWANCPWNNMDNSQYKPGSTTTDRALPKREQMNRLTPGGWH